MPVEKFLSFQGSKIFYRTIGEGPAVVLLHGIPLDGNIWNNQIKTLQGFRFIIPDVPGSGKSELIENVSMEEMAEVIKAILENENISSACLIGHSLGGYIALAFAEKYSNYLSGLGLFHSTAYPDNEERKAARKKAIESIEKDGAYEFLKNSTPKLFAPQKEKNQKHIDELVEETKKFSSLALVSYYKAMMQRPDRTSVLTTLKFPLLLIAGNYDTAIPLNDVLAQGHLAEKTFFHILTESGHMGMIEEPEKANKMLADYLASISGQS